ncbi:hypothetical protein SASC598J21_000080, partial [Snodgrassella alvi SCGC AB-598-J21]
SDQIGLIYYSEPDLEFELLSVYFFLGLTLPPLKDFLID